MVDHDQRFKSLLKTFFAEFFQAFFPAWADRFDFARVDWLEQEVFTDPPRGSAAASTWSPACHCVPAYRLRKRHRPGPPTAV